jgi:hypothetical protein
MMQSDCQEKREGEGRRRRRRRRGRRRRRRRRSKRRRRRRGRPKGEGKMCWRGQRTMAFFNLCGIVKVKKSINQSGYILL